MIKLDKINKSYGGKKIFENFNLEIEEGKITAVLGESGIGKTTLLNIIAGNTQFEGAVGGQTYSVYDGKPQSRIRARKRRLFKAA